MRHQPTVSLPDHRRNSLAVEAEGQTLNAHHTAPVQVG